MKNIPGDVSCETAGRGQASMLLHHSQPRIYKKKSATKKDISVESLGHPHHPSSPPEGVQFQLNTLPVIASCVGDGDGFTAFIDTADPREATYVPQEVHKALVARAQARCRRDYQRMDALASAIKDAGYLIVNGSNNQEILARKYRIRMRGIDAPELEMEYGMESRNELVNLIEGKCVMIHVYEMDQYERYIGDVYCDGVFIQEQMLKRGFAWYCEIYDKRCEFGQWEGEARAARQGLWLSDNPEKPWEWKRNHPRNAGKQDFLQKRPQKAQPILETQMDDESCEALSRMIKEEKNAEEKATGWEKELESVVAENRMLNDLLRESKEALQNEKEACNAEEKEARQRKKELESALAEKRMLNELLRKSKEALQNEKEACNAEEGKARQWKKELESALAEKRMLNELLRKSKEALQNEKEACNAEGGKARQWKKELESALAEKRMLNELLRKSNEALQNEKACNAEGGKARQWKKELESVVAENRMLKYLLWESEKEAEEKARQWKEVLESVEAKNRMLKWESEKEADEKARRWIEELESVEAENHMLKTVCWVGTSLLTVGIALLCSKWKTPPK